MRSGKQRSLSRDPHHRVALMRNMASSLILHGRITTTSAKAKELRGTIDRAIVYGKKGTSATRSKLQSLLNNPEAVEKVYSEYVARFADRPSGFTRIIRLSPRKGDQAEQVVIEFLS
jgi:large subunit ribosomal protein L17